MGPEKPTAAAQEKEVTEKPDYQVVKICCRECWIKKFHALPAISSATTGTTDAPTQSPSTGCKCQKEKEVVEGEILTINQPTTSRGATDPEPESSVKAEIPTETEQPTTSRGVSEPEPESADKAEIQPAAEQESVESQISYEDGQPPPKRRHTEL